jgi:hypothetical protein
MAFPRARVVAAACLFVGWLGYLGYLAAVARNPIVVSRPQVLVSNLGVLALVENVQGKPAATVTVTDVLWPAEDRAELAGKTIAVENLVEVSDGWVGAGEYFLALTRRRLGKETYYVVTPLPPVPGFHPARDEARIYPNTEDVLRQVRSLKPGE